MTTPGYSSRSQLRAMWRLHKSAFLYHRKHRAHGPLRLYCFWLSSDKSEGVESVLALSKHLLQKTGSGHKWVHAKRKAVEPEGLLGTCEFAERVCGLFDCSNDEHLTVAQYIA